MTKIIGLTAPIEGGKSTVAQAIHRECLMRGTTSIVMGFAQPLKSMMETLLRRAGIHEDDAHPMVHSREHRDVPMPLLQHQTMRHALQTLGTEWGRDCLGKDFWTGIGIARAKRSRADVVIIDDCRFHTELEAIRREGGEVFELMRDGVAYPAGHRSEGEIAGFCPHIDNNREPEVVARDILGRML